MPRSNRSGETTAFAQRLQGELATLEIDVTGWSAARQEQFRDDLAGWLSGHGLSLGGDLAFAVIYRPQGDSGGRDGGWRALRRWLATRLEQRHRLQLKPTRLGTSSRLHAAALEAVASAQMTLVEQTLGCTWDLHQIARSRLPHSSSKTRGSKPRA